MRKTLVILLAFTATFTFGQAVDSIQAKNVPCKPATMQYAVQIASTSNIELLMQRPSFHEQVIDEYKLETACLKDGKVVYRVMIPAEDLTDAYIKHSYYRRTQFRDCFIVNIKDGVRLN